MFAMLSDPQLL